MMQSTAFFFIAVALLSYLTSGFSHSHGNPLPLTSAVRSSSASTDRNDFARVPQRNIAVRPLQSIPTFHRSDVNNNAGGLSTQMSPFAVRGGGALAASRSSEEGKDLNLTTGKVVASLWGTVGVAYILLKAIKRVVPIALEPFSKGAGVVPLTQFELVAYIAMCLWFAYVEGYKGFQLKFSPLVVSRSFTLQPGVSPAHHLLLAPLYSMGLFHATKKRMIVSWCVSIGVAAIVAAVKRMPYPWRNIVDAGVVVGLSWGMVSILGGYLISLFTGIAPIGIDPALPAREEKE